VTNIKVSVDDQSVAHKRGDGTYFTRGYATSVNLHCRSLSVDSGIEETCETKWINSPFLKVGQRKDNGSGLEYDPWTPLPPKSNKFNFSPSSS